jgi:hypothetical protein
MGAHPGGHPGGIGAHHTAADHHHLGRADAGHATKQHAAPAIGLLQRPGTHLRRKPARDLGHRREEWQAAGRVGDRLIGDGGDAAGQQVAGLRRVRREVKIGEQHLIRAQKRALPGLRFLDLHDQFGTREHLVRAARDLGPGGAVIAVGKPRTGACPGLDQDRMAARRRLAGGVRRQPDAVFLRLDFPWAADPHLFPRSPRAQHRGTDPGGQPVSACSA